MTNPLNRQSSHAAKGPSIRVLLKKNVNSAYLEAKGEYRVVAARTGSYLSSGISGKRFIIHGMKEGLRWGEEYPDIYQIKVFPTSDETTFFLDGIQYRGAMVIMQGEDTRVTIVNEVPIEDYLRSTLAIDVSASLSKEALAALVITARTVAFTMTNDRFANLWDVSGEEIHYFGEGVCLQDRCVEQTIADTKYMVLQKGVEASEIGKHFIERIQELSLRGLNANEIIRREFPHTKIVSDYTHSTSRIGISATPKPRA
ncbi:MAG: SpoIID/LytB domain-containing protein [Chlamydiia bacterium]|nr:SpoIID/LytB domain-containing protein [Chlamydiia bacterium]